MNKEYFPEEVAEALKKRMESIANAVNENEFPFKGYCLGFGQMEIVTVLEAFGRLRELRELIGQGYEIKNTITKDVSGKSITKSEVIIW